MGKRYVDLNSGKMWTPRRTSCSSARGTPSWSALGTDRFVGSRHGSNVNGLQVAQESNFLFSSNITSLSMAQPA